MVKDDDDDLHSGKLPSWAVTHISKVAVLTSKVERLIDDQKSRAMREWGIILAVVGVLITIIAKSFKWM